MLKRGDLLLATDKGILYLTQKDDDQYEQRSKQDTLKYVSSMRVTKNEEVLIVGESGKKPEDCKVSKILLKSPNQQMFGRMIDETFTLDSKYEHRRVFD